MITIETLFRYLYYIQIEYFLIFLLKGRAGINVHTLELRGVSSDLGVNSKSFVEASPSLSRALMSMLTFKNFCQETVIITPLLQLSVTLMTYTSPALSFFVFFFFSEERLPSGSCSWQQQFGGSRRHIGVVTPTVLFFSRMELIQP